MLVYISTKLCFNLKTFSIKSDFIPERMTATGLFASLSTEPQTDIKKLLKENIGTIITLLGLK